MTDADYWRDLAEVRRKRVNWLAIWLIVQSTWMIFTLALQLYAEFFR